MNGIRTAPRWTIVTMVLSSILSPLLALYADPPDEKKHRILFYGDSNTWGYIPLSGARYGEDERWTGILENLLGDRYDVINEGLNGRTTVYNVFFFGMKNGLKTLPEVLNRTGSLDLIVIMLGTNDLNPSYDADAKTIAGNAGRLVEETRRRVPPERKGEILLISPPPLTRIAPPPPPGSYDAVAVSEGFAEAFRAEASRLGVHFFDAGSVVTSSPRDGVHWESEAHKSFASAIASIVRKILAPEIDEAKR